MIAAGTMYVIAAVSLLFATLVLQANTQDCPEYNVTVRQVNDVDVEGANVSLTCTIAGNPTYTTIGWDVSSVITDPPRQAYTYYAGFPDITGPSTPFIGRLDGSMEGQNHTHTLIILKANTSDQLNVWRCVVKTFICTGGNVDTLNLTLKESDPESNLTLFVNGMPKTSSSNADVNDSSAQSKEDVMVRCVAISDQPSTVSLRGLDPDSQQECEPVAGPPPQPWSCSVTGKMPNVFLALKESKNVYCVANRSATLDKTREDFKIAFQYSDEEIVVIVILCLMGLGCISIIVCCIINCCCFKRLPCSPETRDKICIPQMFTEKGCCPPICKGCCPPICEEKNCCYELCYTSNDNNTE